MNRDLLLKEAVAEGIIDLDTILAQLKMKEDSKYLKMHHHDVWQDKDGKYLTYLPATETSRRKLIRRVSKEKLEHDIAEFYKAHSDQMKVDDVFENWISRKKEFGEIKPQTVDRYRSEYNKYMKDRIGGFDMISIDEDDLERYIKTTIRDYKMTIKQWSDLRILINGIYKRAKKLGCTNISIALFMKELEMPYTMFRKSYQKDEDNVFTNKEVDKITQYILDGHITPTHLGIILAFQTGLRCGELAALTWSDVDGKRLIVDKTEVHYKGEDGKYVYEIRDETKGRDGHRYVVLTDSALKTIRQIRMLSPFTEYVFTYRGKRVSSKAFTRRLYKICDAVGIPRRSIHKARKTYATKLLKSGVSDRIVMKQLGHTDIATTRKHYLFNNEEVLEIYEKLNKIV